jgi:Ca-activated chloride channel family protein
MAEAFSVRCKLDQPTILVGRSEEIHALVTVEPNTAVLGTSVAPPALPAHLFALVDVSGSMDYLMRHDPAATTLGRQLTEGRDSVSVTSTVPSRREVAALVVHRLIEGLGHDDRLTLIAFDNRPYLLASGLAPANRNELREALVQLGRVGGGGTAAGAALEMVRHQLAAVPEQGRACKLILLTDGEDDEPDRARAEVTTLAKEPGLPLAAFGMGECKVAFLAELARATLAGGFYHVRDDNDAGQLFQQAVSAQKNVVATNATLKLWLSPDLLVRDLYRTRPEILYVGDLKPDEQNVVALPLEQLERGKGYEFLFRCLVPPRGAGQRFRLAKATLTYDLPAWTRSETVEANIVVEYTDSEEQARQRSGDVRRVLARAEVQRQVLFLQGKIDALERGAATAQERSLVAKLLDALVRQLDGLGDTAMANQYRTLQTEFLQSGTISQEMLNRSLAASSRAEEVIVAQDIDF